MKMHPILEIIRNIKGFLDQIIERELQYIALNRGSAMMKYLSKC